MPTNEDLISSVNLNITSIATYLPSSTEHENAAFAGTTSRQPNPPALTPIQEANIRAQQIEKQNKDADERNVVWSVEDAVELHDTDGECEDDPDYVQLPDGSYQKIALQTSGPDSLTPIGLRNEAGEIEPLPFSMSTEEAHFGGVSEPTPTRLDQLVGWFCTCWNLCLTQKQGCDPVVRTSNIEQTQDLESLTQELSISLRPSQHSPSSSIARNDVFTPKTSGYDWGKPGLSSMSSFTSALSSLGSDTDTQILKNISSNNGTTMDDTEMLGKIFLVMGTMWLMF